MATYIGVRAFNRSQNVRIGQQKISVTTTAYIDISDTNVRKDYTYHSALGSIYVVSPLRKSNKPQGVWTGATVTEGTSSADRSVRVLAGELRNESGAFVAVAQQDLTVSDPDPSLVRVDAVVVDTAGTASVVTGTAAASPVAPSTTSAQTLLATVNCLAGGANEVQRVVVDAAAGTYTLTFSGQTTATIAFNASATTGAGSVRAKLEALSNIDPGDVVVTGGPGDAGGTTPYTVTFGGQYHEADVAQMTSDAALLTGGASTATVSTTTGGVTVGIANASITDARERFGV